MAEPNKIDRSPHAAAAAVVQWFIPEHHREYVIGDLCKQSLSSLSYLAKGLEWLAFIVTGQLRPAFSSRLFCAEAAALAAAFAGAPMDQGFFIGLSAGLVGLVLRDAYVYPKRGTPFHEGVDTAAALVFLIGVETFEVVFAPAHALPEKVMLRGLALALLTVSMVRVILRRPRRPEPFGTASYTMTRFMTCLWMGAALIVKAMNPPFVPQLIAHQDFWLTLLPIVAFALAFRLQKNAIDGSLTGGSTTVLQDHYTSELARKRDRLWTAPETRSMDFPWHLAFEFLAFGFYGLPLAITLLSWAVGYIPPSQMDWLVVGTTSSGFLSLSVLWIAIRQANQNMAGVLREDMERRKTS